jgi:hypothetical protein
MLPIIQKRLGYGIYGKRRNQILAFLIARVNVRIEHDL